MKKFTTIYINGSSLSCGGSLEVNTEAFKYYIQNYDIPKWDNSKDVSYGNVLANMIGAKAINESKQGGGLDRLIRKSYNYINSKTNKELKETLFVFDIPIQPSRFEVYSKQFKDWFTVSIAYRNSEESPSPLTISMQDGDIESILSLSRDYGTPSLNLNFSDMKKHCELLSQYASEYHDYMQEANRLLRELTFFYCYLDKLEINYIRDISDVFFAGSINFGNTSNDDFFDRLKMFEGSNQNAIDSPTIWRISSENKWTIKDEIGIEDSHLGYYGNRKYAEYLHNLLISNNL